MQVRQADITAERGARRPARWWRCLVLVLLVLIPVTLTLAGPAPVHHMPADTAEYEPGLQGQGPSDTPVCDHAGHHSVAPVVISDNRESELPSPAHDIAALLSQGPALERKPSPVTAPRTTLSAGAPPLGPVYLLTLRIRV